MRAHRWRRGRWLVLALLSAQAACNGGGSSGRGPGGPDAHVDVDASPTVVDAAGSDGPAGDAASVDGPVAIDAATSIDAPTPIAEAWTDLGQADGADGTNQRVMGGGGLALDASGGITVVWRQGGFAGGSSQSRVWGNHYVPGTGWGTPLMLQGDDYDNYGELLIIGATDGSATAIWTQKHGFPDEETPPDLWANRFVPGAGWTGAQRLETEAGAADNALAWLDGSGRVNVAWRQAVGASSEIRTTRFDPATGWAPATALAGSGADPFGFRDVVVDAAGDLLAVWIDGEGLTGSLRANRLTAGAGWGTPVVLQATVNGPANPRLAANPHGDAVVVWYRHDDTGDGYSVWSDHYRAGGGWDGAVEIDHTDVSAWTPDVAIDPSGNATAVWAQQTAVGHRTWSSRFTPGAGWSEPEPLTGDGGYDPHVVIDAHGDAMATWWDYGQFTWARRFVPGAGWQPAHLLQHEELADPGFPRLVGLPDGRVAVSMIRARNHLAVATYTPGSP